MPQLQIKIPSEKVKKHSKKWWYKTLDDLFSPMIREKGFCERCGSRVNKLNHAHVIGRANKALRYDILNAMCLCVHCHFWWHENPTESGLWFAEKYPERKTYLDWAKLKFVDRTEDDFKILEAAIRNRQFNLLVYTP